jgi:phosphoribosylformimino-5-aminoimidazole carboxamide ribotide isomerase
MGMAASRDGAAFELLPAIDLRAGRVVRLREGDFDREVVYGDDPIEVVARFRASGATWVHVVDLDRARGVGSQVDVVGSLVAAALPVRCQAAGGLRTEAAVGEVLDFGAMRVVIGTAALEDPGFAASVVNRFGPERIVAALDVRDGLAVGEGWRAGAPGRPVMEALDRLADAGVPRFAVTAIARDGLLGGPDLGLLEQLVGAGRGAIIASGGIASIDDLQALRDLGCAGAIVGSALYEGRIDLAEAVAAFA